MDSERRERLEKTMAGLADGDLAMLFALQEHFGPDIRWALTGLARRLDLRVPDRDELDGLVLDACDELAEVARWWRPEGGALPWVYGQERLANLLRRHAGPPTRPLLDDDDLGDGGGGVVVAPRADDRPAVLVLDRLVTDDAHPVLVVLREALARVASERDQELALLYLQQQSEDDPSPSHTVGALLELRPDAVRQAFHRARKRLRTLAVTDGRYRPLLALPFLVDDAATAGGTGARLSPVAGAGTGDDDASEVAA